MVKIVEPTQIRITVRMPAGLSRRSLSMPTRAPQRTEPRMMRTPIDARLKVSTL